MKWGCCTDFIGVQSLFSLQASQYIYHGYETRVVDISVLAFVHVSKGNDNGSPAAERNCKSESNTIK